MYDLKCKCDLMGFMLTPRLAKKLTKITPLSKMMEFYATGDFVYVPIPFFKEWQDAIDEISKDLNKEISCDDCQWKCDGGKETRLYSGTIIQRLIAISFLQYLITMSTKTDEEIEKLELITLKLLEFMNKGQ